MDNTRIESSVDLTFNLLIWSVVFIIVIVIFLVPENEQFFIIMCDLPVLLLLLWTYFGTYYELKDEYLYCKCGPFFEKIRYEKIRCAKLSENLLSSMALSTKRIEISQFGKGYFLGTTLISPIDREKFLLQLIKRCPNIEDF